MSDLIIIQELAKALGIPVSRQPSREMLAEKVNELLEKDFERLVQVLYRMDVNEAKLKLVLKENPGVDAGLIIADLMIERQVQKNRSKQEFKRDENIDDGDKW